MRYTWAFKRKVRQAIRNRRSRSIKNEKITLPRIEFSDDIPLIVQYKSSSVLRTESLKENCEVYILSDTSLKATKSDVRSKANEISTTKGIAIPKKSWETVSVCRLDNIEDNISSQESGDSLVIDIKSRQAFGDVGYEL